MDSRALPIERQTPRVQRALGEPPSGAACCVGETVLASWLITGGAAVEAATRYAHVLRLMYCQQPAWTVTAVATSLHVSRARAHILRKTALWRLRRALSSGRATGGALPPGCRLAQALVERHAGRRPASASSRQADKWRRAGPD